jgi:PDZ domain/Caspase domain
MTRCAPLRLAVACLAAVALPALCGAADEAARVQALVVVDSLDKNIGKTVTKDGKLIARMLEDGFKADPQGRLTLKEMDGASATPAGVLNYIDGLPEDPEATLLVYFSGHGATDSKKGHFLALQKDPTGERLLYRSQLLAKMQEKRPRLLVLISDCCAPVYDIRPTRDLSTLRPNWDTVRQLLLQHRGVVNLNACAEGELSWTGRDASIFTVPLAAALCKAPRDLDENGDGFVHWQEVFPRLQKETQDDYDKMRDGFMQAYDRMSADEKERYADSYKTFQKYPYQTAFAYALPPRWRFGARVTQSGGALRVTEVFDHSPAAAAGLRAGDVIQEVNGRAVRDPVQFAEALADSQEAGVKIRRLKKETLAKVALAPWKAAKGEAE